MAPHAITAAARWSEALARWRIPDEILASAPESPWGFPSSVFVDVARAALASPLCPTHERALEELPDGGTVLDVGAGGGAASLPLAPTAGVIVAVDGDVEMLNALTELAGDLVEVRAVEGRWPDVAPDIDAVDVAVCANVAYNVADLAPFVAALTTATRHRVVLELSADHPQIILAPLWQHFWGIERPDGPTADDALAVVRETIGSEVRSKRWTRASSFMGERGPDTVGWMRRRLCLPAEADAEVAEQLDRIPSMAPAAMVTAWWDGSA